MLLKDEDTEALLAADFEIGHFIRERIVPRAVLYFTGEALEDDEFEEEEGEEEEVRTFWLLNPLIPLVLSILFLGEHDSRPH